MTTAGSTHNYGLRKTAKIALVSEFGGDSAPLRLVAREAINRGMYSSNTVIGDIEGALQRAWRQWRRTPKALGQRVLVVDDDSTVLDSLGLLISDIGHIVETANSAADALERINTTDFDLVLTDITMPVVSGEDLAREIKTRKPQLRVVLVSGRHVPSQGEGALEFLAKPFSLEQLKLAIERAH
jgi:CheY-like chemotaxis protein